jgi:predicted transcriptional regulator
MKTKKIDDEKLFEMLRQGMQQKEIAQIMGVSAPAICQRLRKLLPPPESLTNLTDKEKSFVLEKAKGRSNTQAVIASQYEVTSMQSAKVIGSQLMDKPEIRKAIDDLMEMKGVGREFRIEKLGQHMKNRDPNVSLKALDIGFKLANDYPAQRNINLNTDLSISPVDIDRWKRGD